MYQLPGLLVAGDVKEHHDSTEDTVDDGEASVHGGVLLILCYGATHEAGEGEWQDDEQSALTDGSCGLLNLLKFIVTIQVQVRVQSPSQESKSKSKSKSKSRVQV